MRTSDECLTKASDMILRAIACHAEADRDRFLVLSDAWREAAREAQRQDRAVAQSLIAR